MGDDIYWLIRVSCAAKIKLTHYPLATPLFFVGRIEQPDIENGSWGFGPDITFVTRLRWVGRDFLLD